MNKNPQNSMNTSASGKRSQNWQKNIVSYKFIKATKRKFRQRRNLPAPLRRKLPELVAIEGLIRKFGSRADVDILATVPVQGYPLPVYSITLGSKDVTSPAFVVVGGVHGLEKIGTHLAINYMRSILRNLHWDSMLNDYLEKARLIFIPLLNPGGMQANKRSNLNGVDLMRNAPVEAEEGSRFNPVVGHRISPKLPWYRGAEGKPMEQESKGLVKFMQRNVFESRAVIAIDLHSGFGLRDRLWFPYAKSSRPLPDIHLVYSLLDLFMSSYPNHVYKIEPQSASYTTHGDLWDHMYDLYREKHQRGLMGDIKVEVEKGERLFLPLCLEMGSWSWVKKNPKQVFSALGAFNPQLPHRFKRTMRRHLVLLDFLMRATLSFDVWSNMSDYQKGALRAKAIAKWF